MGGNKSKPVAESARNVISRTKPSDVHVTPVISRETNFESKNNIGNNNVELDSTIVNEMSKWSFIKSAPEKNATSVKITMSPAPPATMIRLEEEKKLSSQPSNTYVMGRLDEKRLMEFYKKNRLETNYTVKKASEEFSIPENIVLELLDVAKYPILVHDESNKEKSIAT